jgi:hypothetical protein
MKAAAVLAFAAHGAQGVVLRKLSQDPDTSCGKGFEKLVPGSKDYFATAQEKLWTHPGQTGQEDTFEEELKCWYANMITTKCGGMTSKYEARNAVLTEQCSGVGQDWLQVWKQFSAEEVQYYKKNFPAEAIEEGGDTHYKQAMKTALDLNKREVLCMTLFVIDDECGAHSHIRMTNNGKEAALIAQSAKQEPDTTCGKSFEHLVPGSKDYFVTAQEKLWTHPGQTGQEDTFEQELQCWYANMITGKCGGMPSQYASRNAALTQKCTGVGEDWLQVWKQFSAAEVQYYKKNFPAEPIEEGGEAHYKQAMKTALDLNKREVLCMTLFLIDDECGAHSHIRVAQ